MNSQLLMNRGSLFLGHLASGDILTCTTKTHLQDTPCKSSEILLEAFALAL